MGQISTLFVHKVIRASASHRPDGEAYAADLFASIAVDPQAPIDPKSMVSAADYYALCSKAAREDAHGASLPIRVGSLMRCDDYGAFGLAWKSAINLRGSYERAARYGRVLTSVATYELRHENGRWFDMLHRAGDRHLGMRLSNEQTIVAITQISREVSLQAFDPVRVHFKHPAPNDISAHEAYFRCPVIFGSDRDAIEVSAGDIAAPNTLGDAKISAFFDTHLEEELAALVHDGGLAQRVRIQVSQALSEGVPAISDIASALGMSGRTLQRRLSGIGSSYQDVVDDARRELAEKLLKTTDYPLAEIAFLTGFSEQSAFTRAFKRWSGQTPRSFRLKA